MPHDGATGSTGLLRLQSISTRLDVTIPLKHFCLGDLKNLKVGQVLRTDWSIAEDLPVFANDKRLLWTEFAVADQRLTVRVTRIA